MVKKLFHSHSLICAIFALVSIAVMIFNLYIMKENRVYVFGGYSDDVTVMDGSIFTSLQVNRFAAPSILYSGKDKTLSEYTIGYYIGDEAISIISNETNDLKDISLIELIRNSQFSFTESHNDAKFLSHNNLKNIDKLKFKIKAITNSKEEIAIEVPLDVTKIS